METTSNKPATPLVRKDQAHQGGCFTLRRLLIAVGDYLEWKMRPHGFVREPIYNLAKSYREYLTSLEVPPWPTAIEDFDRFWAEEIVRLSAMYEGPPVNGFPATSEPPPESPAV